MKYQVNERCITCNTCVYFCPTQAIHRDNPRFVIDQDKCVGCGLCAKKCPAMAIEEIDIQAGSVNEKIA